MLKKEKKNMWFSGFCFYAFEDVTYLWKYHMQLVTFSRDVKMLWSNVYQEKRLSYVTEPSSFCMLVRLRSI